MRCMLSRCTALQLLISVVGLCVQVGTSSMQGLGLLVSKVQQQVLDRLVLRSGEGKDTINMLVGFVSWTEADGRQTGSVP